MLKLDIKRIKEIMKDDGFTSAAISEATTLLNGIHPDKTLRDEFAMVFLHSNLTNQNIIDGLANKHLTLETLCESSYHVADIMLKVRNK